MTRSNSTNTTHSNAISSNQSWKYYLALASSAAALATHFYLSKHYFELNLGLTSGSAICNINSTFNCDTVSASKFATLFGIPMAIWGLTTQLIVFLFTLIYALGLSADRARAGRFTFYMSLLVAATSVIMGGISTFLLTSYCLFCIFAYFLSFVHLYAIGSNLGSHSMSFMGEDLKAAVSHSKGFGITIASIIPLVLLFNNMFLDHFGGSLLKDTVESSFLGWRDGTAKTFTSEGLTKGPENAKMVIIEFADFLCPHCKHAAPTMKVFTNSHPDVKLIFKAFPLDGSCNADPKMPKGDGARCVLAKTVHCAEKIAKKGWDIYEQIFEEQEQIYSSGNTTEYLKTMMDKNKIDNAAMETCRSSEETHKSIVAQSQEGLQAQIEGTPTFYVNNKYLSRGQLIPVLQRVYDSL